MRTSPLALFAAAALAAVPAQAARVEIILDVSGSMRAQMGAETRIDAARKAIRATLAGIQPDSVVGLRLYGHRVSQDNKAESCKDTELAVPFQPVDKPAFQAMVDRAMPRGQTPLTYSLEQAARDFGPASDEERVIILVSDGEESCGGNPEAAARNLLAQGFKLKVHTIGFDVDAAARAQLEAISSATGGEYHDARNAAALAESLTRLAQKSLLVAKTEEGLGQPVRGGNGYESAVEIKPGQLYRLDHHQRKGEYDYFYVPVSGRTKVTASVETTQAGVTISGDSFTENQNPYAAIALQDGNRRKLGDTDIIGSRGEKKTLQGVLPADNGGRMYILVGSSLDAQHKDSRFQVDFVAQAGDAGSSRDAGATESDALPIKPGLLQAHLDGDQDDSEDFFKFRADPAATYLIRVRPTRHETWLQISVSDSEGQVSRTERAPNWGDAARMADLRFPKGGDVYVRVSFWTPGERPDTDYSIELKQEGGGATPPGEGEAAGASLGERVRGFFRKVLSAMLWAGIFLGVFLIGGVAGYVVGRRRRP